jgi:hypothetical protein
MGESARASVCSGCTRKGCEGSGANDEMAPRKGMKSGLRSDRDPDEDLQNIQPNAEASCRELTPGLEKRREIE